MGKFPGEIISRATIRYDLQDKKFIKNNQQVNLVCRFNIHYFLITNMGPGNHGCKNHFRTSMWVCLLFICAFYHIPTKHGYTEMQYCFMRDCCCNYVIIGKWNCWIYTEKDKLKYTSAQKGITLLFFINILNIHVHT